jgi:serine/threonine-protein kinase RsbW
MSPTTERLLYERALPAAADNVAMVRHELGVALDAVGIDAARRDDIALVIAEAASNAVLHAYPPPVPGLLFVDAGLTGRNLLLRVCDCGRGMAPRTDSPGLGIGLSLISRLADGVEIAPNRSVGGTRVSAVFHDVMPVATTRRISNRREAFALHEYARALEAVSEGLQSDTSALIAQAQQAIDQSQRLRAERAVYV